MIALSRVKNLGVRGAKYSVVGISTYLLDLSILALLLTFTPLHYLLAVAIGFLVGISVNFLISYHWAFKGTEQKPIRGYVFFVLIAFSGVTIATVSVGFLVIQFSVPVLIARTLVGSLTGTANFLINAVFNFKVA